MNIRLHATPAECAAAIARLARTPGLRILDTSRPYPNRASELVRVYLTVDLDPAAASDATAAEAVGRCPDCGGVPNRNLERDGCVCDGPWPEPYWAG